MCRVIIFIFSRSHNRRSFTGRLVDETRLCVKEFTRDFAAKSQAASLAAVDAVRLNTDGAREASSKIARSAGKAHQKLERASYISTLAKELHKICAEEEEENRKEERELKAALALIQTAGRSDRRSPQRSNRRYLPPSVSGRSDRRLGQSSGHSDRRNSSHSTSGQTDRRSTNQRDRSNTAGRISYYQSTLPDSQVRWSNKIVSAANSEPLGQRPVSSSSIRSISAVGQTGVVATTSAALPPAVIQSTVTVRQQSSVEQQLPLSALTLSDPVVVPTSVPLPTGSLPDVTKLFDSTRPSSSSEKTPRSRKSPPTKKLLSKPDDRLQQRCEEIFGDQFEAEDLNILSPAEKAALLSEPSEEAILNSPAPPVVNANIIVDNKVSSDVVMSGDE